MTGHRLVSLDEAVLGLRTTEEATAFLKAILSPKEYLHIRGRWTAFQLKRAGYSHREVVKRAGVATATVSRSSALVGTPVLDEVLHRIMLDQHMQPEATSQ